jgi:RND superfamily putative drug exporter
MSVLLYRLGGFVGRHRGLVVGAWLLVLAAVVGGSLTLGPAYDDGFSVPGTQSQEGEDLIRDRFGQSGTTAQVVLEVDRGRVTGKAHARAVADIASEVDDVAGASMSNPLGPPPGYDAPVLSDDGRATLGIVSFADVEPSQRTLDQVQRAAVPPPGSDLTTYVGGNAYSASGDPSRVPELIGLLVSLMILAVTFGSFVTAGMPILTALVGVGSTLAGLAVLSNVVSINSASPHLAEMLGLAVGIDYALFILSRYRRQLADPGLTPAVAMSRALATAGSAVVFAGTTVVIALTGLAVARIPVLTVMGLAAASAVLVAVTVALTLLPALALLLGERLRPRSRPGTRRPRLRLRRRPRGERVGVPTRWVRLVTAKPLLTVAAVVVVMVLASVPAARLELALPDNGSDPAGSAPRETYDAVIEAFGEGWNAPLTVTASVITSDDPVGTVDSVAAAFRTQPGVVAVPQATPNQSADTALFQVIPAAGQTAPSTAALVTELRDRSPEIEQRFGISDILVTGPTAVNIDVSDRLGASLLPFAAIVIGLSLFLLMIVFRSLAVPVKATLGYLLSVGTALGAVVVVFQWGALDAVLPLPAAGPVVSFLPIFLMGVLFGLAMDYEMFLVSAMREEYVGSHHAREAVHRGFRASSVVVTAAALIMTSVFVTFIPGGSTTIQPIAFGLAVGVLADAFLVRMTLVPAVLVLLGDRAWWLPRWLDARIPSVDVEGAALHRKIAYEDWERTHGTAALVARDVVVADGVPPVQVLVQPGRVGLVDVPPGLDPADLGRVLVGRQRPRSGDLVVGGLLLPEQREQVQRRTVLLEVGPVPTDDPPPDALVRRAARLAAWSRGGRAAFAERAAVLRDGIDAAARAVGDPAGPRGRAAVSSAVTRAAVAAAGGAVLVVVVGEGPESSVPPGTARAIARALADHGITSVVLDPGAAPGTRTGAPAPDDLVAAEEGPS